jgi:cellulose synthase/poly-beta-1,6-N-acetylglucosamine synthase-like glycosyltransferase
VVLDGDSIISHDFVAKMLNYAEHPDNQRIAIFQSKTRTWNTSNRFAQTLAAIEPMWYFPLERLANRCNMLLPWGHNMLCRTEAILQVGGFGEEYLSEDYEIAVRLLQIGYASKLVNILSWDAMPEDVDAYAKRSVRWAQGIFQIVRGNIGKVPLIVKFRLTMAAYYYLVQVLYVLALFLIVWSYHSSLLNLYIFLQFLLTGAFLQTSFWRPLLLIGFYLSLYLLLQPLLARRLGVSFRQFFSHAVLGVAVGLYSATPLMRGIWRTIRTGEGVRTIMPKPGISPAVRATARSKILTYTLSGLMLVGMIRNPVSLVFNFMWLLPFVLAPLILRLFHRSPREALTDISSVLAPLYPTFSSVSLHQPHQDGAELCSGKPA